MRVILGASEMWLLISVFAHIQPNHQGTMSELFSSYYSSENWSDDSIGLVEAGLIGTDFQVQSSCEPSIFQNTFNSVQAS